MMESMDALNAITDTALSYKPPTKIGKKAKLIDIAKPFTFYEFFAGGGMARAGLGARWKCLFANDFDPKKGRSYQANWGGECLKVDDVANLTTRDLPDTPSLVWASFPCQDLSLAGAGAGLGGERSGTFWPFWKLIKKLVSENRSPNTIVLENVCGALTSNQGKDFAAIGNALTSAGYRFGGLVMDASYFVPQSRPRLFIVAVQASMELPEKLVCKRPSSIWHSPGLLDAYENLPKAAKSAWVWWKLPQPPKRQESFIDLIEEEPTGTKWHTQAETKKLLAMMHPLHLKKVDAAKASGKTMAGTIYKRTRNNGKNGEKVQRAEIRFDDIAGCLRTPSGGSSRQTIMVINGNCVRSRLLSTREAARLMGLSDDYKLPTNYNEAYHLVGDGLVVPVVRFLSKNILDHLQKQKGNTAK